MRTTIFNNRQYLTTVKESDGQNTDITPSNPNKKKT